MTTENRLNLAASAGVASAATQIPIASGTQLDIALIDLEPQIRTKIGEVTELVECIKFDGVNRPIFVHAKDNGRYRLVAGERRLRASKRADLA